MAKRTKQDKFTLPMSVGQRFRSWCKEHRCVSYADGVTKLLDSADQRDHIERNTTIMERTIKVFETVVQNNQGVFAQSQTSPVQEVPEAAESPLVAHKSRLMPIGQYKGKPVTDIITNYPDYIATLLAHANEYSNPFTLTSAELDLYDRVRQQR